MRIGALTMLTVLCVICAGCGNGGLSRSRAADLAKSSAPLMGKYSFELMAHGGQPEETRLIAAGYLAVTKDNVYSLTTKGRQLLPDLKDCSTLFSTCWTFTVANKQFIGITGVSSGNNSNQAEVDYTWKWVPNEAGRVTGTVDSNTVFTCKMLAQRFDDGWRSANVFLDGCY
jgi:hypothetical protein